MKRMQNGNYVAIDCARLFFCLCIIALHCKFHTIFLPIISYGIEKIIFRIAVPFFFVVSGFFLGRTVKKSPDINNVVKKRIIRLLLPLAVFGSINIILEIIKMIIEHKNIKYILEDVIRHALFYQYGALWYVGACIIGIILLLPFLRKRKLNLALSIGALLYLFGLLCNNYYFLTLRIPMLQKVIDNYLAFFISGRNGLFVGFFLIALGVKTSEVYNNHNWSMKRCVLLLLVCIVFYVLEILFVVNKVTVDDGALYISHILLVPALVLFLCGIKFERLQGLSLVLRYLSSGMYFLHRIIISCIHILKDLFGIMSSNVVAETVMVVVIGVTICLTVKKGSRMHKLLS